MKEPQSDPFVRALDESITGLTADGERWRTADWSRSTFTFEDLQRALRDLYGPKRVLIVCPQDEPAARAIEAQLREVNIVEIRASEFVPPGTAYVVLHPDELELGETFLSRTEIQPPMLARRTVRLRDIIGP